MPSASVAGSGYYSAVAADWGLLMSFVQAVRSSAVRSSALRLVVLAALVGAMLVATGTQAGATVHLRHREGSTGATSTVGATTRVRQKNPSITLTASPKTVTTGDGTVTLSYSVANTSSCYFNPNPAAGIYQEINPNCPGNPTGTETVVLPLNTSKKAITYKFSFSASGTTTKVKTVRVTVDSGKGRAPLTGVTSVVASAYGSQCAIVASGVDCWGSNDEGSLGSGLSTGPQTCSSSQGGCATTPVPVVGVGGVGKLTGVAQLAVDDSGTYCARLTAGTVDCWGPEFEGELGNNSGTGPVTCPGSNWSCSPTPVQVVDASGPLTGVSDLRGSMGQTFCALLTSGGVDCWGFGGDSNTGNGSTTWTNPIAAPVIAVGTEGEPSPPPLTGVASLSDGGIGFCAILTSSGVVCWGFNRYGNLGMGGSDTAPNNCHGEYPPPGDCSAEPQVVVTSDQSPLTGVSKVVPDGFYGWCAILSSGLADCWGDNSGGETGSGSVSSSASCYASQPCLPYATPVVATTGTGTLSDVKALVSSITISGGGVQPAMCAIATSGGVDCWGYNQYDELGDAVVNSYSATPVVVDAPGSRAPIVGVTGLAAADFGFCAVASGGLDCWGGDAPVSQVASVGGTGILSGVSSVTPIPYGYSGSCALLTSSDVDCFDTASNEDAELGNGGFEATSVPSAPSPPLYSETPTSVLGPVG